MNKLFEKAYLWIIPVTAVFLFIVFGKNAAPGLFILVIGQSFIVFLKDRLIDELMEFTTNYSNLCDQAMNLIKDIRINEGIEQ